MVNIYYGTDTEILNHCLFDGIRKELEEIRSNPLTGEDGREIFRQVLLIVPAQFTLDAEKMALEALGGDGFFDFHIMSGNKLRQDILRQTGGPGRTAINTLGRSMLLRSIAAKKGQDFTVFRSVCEKPEFLRMAGDFIVQLNQNRYRASDLAAIRGCCPDDGILKEKLSDMELICSAYEEAMAGKFTDSEGLLQFTTEKVKDSSLVRRSYVWVYDFYSFTPSETAFWGQIMKYSPGLNFVMIHSEDPDSHHYPVTARTIEALKREASSIGTDIRLHCCDPGPSDAQTDTALQTLRPAMQAADHAMGAADPGTAREYVLVRCSTPYTMAETIAAKILDLLREGRADCGQIAVLTGDMAGCGAACRRVFTRMGIPFFMDEKRSICHDPAVSFISSLLDAAADGMTGRTVVAMLRTGMLDDDLQDRDLLDRFENYVKLYHLDRDRFQSPLKYGRAAIGEENFLRLDSLRQKLADLLFPFRDALRQASTVRGKTEVLYHFLADTLHLPDLLDRRAIFLSESSMADASEETAQIWSVIIGLMDQAVELMGDTPVSDDEFRDTLKKAFTDIKVGLLPQQEGRVTLGTVKRSKLHGIRVLFLAGANEGQMPADSSAETLLTEDEQDLLAEKGYVLSKHSSILAEEELLNLRRAIEAPTDLLWIGYALEDSSGTALRPAGFVIDLLEGGAKAEADLENSGDPAGFLSCRSAAVGRLGEELRAFAAAEVREPAPVWRQCYNLLKKEDPSAAESLAAAVLFDNRRENLSPKTVTGLYSDSTASRNLTGSLFCSSDIAKTSAGNAGTPTFSYSSSRLENFASCAFSHFIRYGLAPEEEREFGMDSREIGSIYHDCLMLLSRRLNEPAQRAGIALTDPASPWMTVTEEQVRRMVEKILDEMEDREMEGVMKAGPGERFRSSRLRSVAGRFAWQMVQQLRHGKADSMKIETPFGYGGSSAPLTFSTSVGTVKICGRIDRADRTGPFVRIIDYKSGKKVLDRKELENGYALQLMVYLESALGQEPELMPSGMFYYLISDKPQEGTLEDMVSSRVTDEVMAKIAAGYKLNGLFVTDPSAVLTIDTAVFSEPSQVIDARPGKDGTLRSSSGLSMEEFSQLRVSFRDKLAETVRRLNSGSIEAVPHRLGNGSVCDFCGYRGICIFDPAFGANHYK